MAPIPLGYNPATTRSRVLVRIERHKRSRLDLSSYFSEKMESLIEAVRRRAGIKVIRAMLESGANVNERNELGETALGLAIEQNQAEITKLLLRHGAEVNNVNPRGESAMAHALEQVPKFVMAKVLFDAGITVDYTQFYPRYNPLDFALIQNKLDLIEFLASHYRIYSNALHNLAIMNRQQSHLEAARILFKYGADPNVVDDSGNTPAQYLIMECNPAMVELFLENGADFLIADARGISSLELTIHMDRADILDVLLRRGLDVNVRLIDGKRPLHVASSRRWPRSMRLLLKNGADTRAVDDSGLTPVYYLYHNSRFYTQPIVMRVMFLLKYSDINVIGNEEENILSPEMPPYLLEFTLQHLAKFQLLDIPIHGSILEIISKKNVYRRYFDKCGRELALAKKTYIRNSWATFADVLMGNCLKLKNWAGNRDFRNNDFTTKFTIYGPKLVHKVNKGIKLRTFYDRSTRLLSQSLPILNPDHLIVRDVFDCLTNKEDLERFCS